MKKAVLFALSLFLLVAWSVSSAVAQQEVQVHQPIQQQYYISGQHTEPLLVQQPIQLPQHLPNQQIPVVLPHPQWLQQHQPNHPQQNWSAHLNRPSQNWPYQPVQVQIQDQIAAKKEVPDVEVITVIPVVNRPAEDICNLLSQLLPPELLKPSYTQFVADSHTNSLVLFSPEQAFTHLIQGLVQKLDKPTKEYIEEDVRIPSARAEEKVVTGFGGHLLAIVKSLGGYETQTMTDAKTRRATEVEITNVLKQYRWIRDAAVISSTRTERGKDLYDKKQIESVAVTVWTHTGEELTCEKRSAITAQVKTAFNITDAKEITITDGNNGVSYFANELQGFIRTAAYAEPVHTEKGNVLEGYQSLIHGNNVVVGMSDIGIFKANLVPLQPCVNHSQTD